MVNGPHTDVKIEKIVDKTGEYWRFDPIDVFGEVGKQVFGRSRARLIVVAYPVKQPEFNARMLFFDERLYSPPLSYEPDLPRGIDLVDGVISGGAKTGSSYTKAQADIDTNKQPYALSLRLIGARPKEVEALSIDRILPYLIESN